MKALQKGGERFMVSEEKYRLYVARIIRLYSLPLAYKQKIVDAYFSANSVEELRQLCHKIQDTLQPIAAYPDYFTVE